MKRRKLSREEKLEYYKRYNKIWRKNNPWYNQRVVKSALDSFRVRDTKDCVRLFNELLSTLGRAA